MQAFELVLITSTTIYILFSHLINNKLSKTPIVVLLVILLLGQLLFEGHRWQMIPGYLLWLIAFITALRGKENNTTSILLRILKTIGFIPLLGLAIGLPMLLPVFDLPKTTGQYAVGTTDIHLQLDREEVITDEVDKRSFMIKAWYPTNELFGEIDPYVDQAGRNGFATKYGLPTPMLNYLDKVETNVYQDVKVLDLKLPVLIFSHGYHSKANGYYALLKEIVSQGYIVFAINHTYESTGTTFTDGKESYFNFDYAGKVDGGGWDKVDPAIKAFKEGKSFEERHPLVREALTNYFVGDMIERWSLDIVDVLDQLSKWNNEGRFKNKLDLSSIGVLGHSRGGGAAGESLLMDSRIKAGANIDGVQWGRIVDTLFQQPFLYLSSDWPASHENLGQHAYINKSDSYFYEGLIKQSGHSNFMDIPFMIPVKSLSQAGDIDPNLAMEITNKVIVSFFDKHLKNKEVEMSKLESEYELLNLKIYAN